THASRHAPSSCGPEPVTQAPWPFTQVLEYASSRPAIDCRSVGHHVVLNGNRMATDPLLLFAALRPLIWPCKRRLVMRESKYPRPLRFMCRLSCFTVER